MFTLRKLARRAGQPVVYETQREQVQNGSAKVRSKLAARDDTRPEILYYLAEDQVATVREAVARNTATPLQADMLLSRDHADSVRCILADKIARLMPEMAADEQVKVRELTRSVLETLAADHLTEVRAIIAEHLKHADNVPPEIVRRLAADVERVVAAPILQYSPLLQDEDLLEIIRITKADGALEAIAKRADVSPDVADAIARGGDNAAVDALLANTSAQIREELLDHLIDRAPGIPLWHEPLVRRPQLSDHAIRRIAGFVAASLVAVLAMRNDLDPETADALAAQVRDSVRNDEALEEDAATQVRRLHAEGSLTEETIDEAVVAGRRDFVIAALALLGDLPVATVERMMALGNAKMATAAVWKAGLGMRLAVKVQSRIAKIPSRQVLYARNGTDYPISDQELAEQIEMVS